MRRRWGAGASRPAGATAAAARRPRRPRGTAGYEGPLPPSHPFPFFFPCPRDPRALGLLRLPDAPCEAALRNQKHNERPALARRPALSVSTYPLSRSATKPTAVARTADAVLSWRAALHHDAMLDLPPLVAHYRANIESTDNDCSMRLQNQYHSANPAHAG